jgi:hypothetical protein
MKRFAKIRLIWLLAVFFTMPVWSQLIPAGHLPGGVLWASNNVGVVGGVPNVTTIYTNFNPGASESQIVAALNRCPSNEVVYLNPGTYIITNVLEYGPWMGGNNGVVLRGAGMGQTTLIFSNAPAVAYLFAANYFGYAPTSNNVMNWMSGLSQGSTHITIDRATDIASGSQPLQVGDLIGLTQGNDPNLVNPIGNENTEQQSALINSWGQLCNQEQIVMVTNIVNGTNLTIWPGVYMTNYQASLHPQVWWTGGTPAAMFGIENITFDCQYIPAGDQDILLECCYNCWLKNCEFTNVDYAAEELVDCAHCTVSECYVHDCASGGQSETYGFNPEASSDILIQDNIFYKDSAPILVDCGCAGCVFGYNFMTNMIFGQSPGWLASCISTHGAHPVLCLFEGNIGTQISYDDIHGSGSHQTVFRNYMSGYEANLNNAANYYANNTYPVVINSTNRWCTFAGNVFGTVGWHTNYQFTVTGYPANYGNIDTIYQLGFFGNSITTGDSLTVTTVARTGNWDTADNGVVWDSNGVQALPASLYLTGEPSWWTSYGNTSSWPPIGPDLTTMVGQIPAQIRYLELSSTNVIVFPPTNLHATTP